MSSTRHAAVIVQVDSGWHPSNGGQPPGPFSVCRWYAPRLTLARCRAVVKAFNVDALHHWRGEWAILTGDAAKWQRCLVGEPLPDRGQFPWYYQDRDSTIPAANNGVLVVRPGDKWRPDNAWAMPRRPLAACRWLATGLKYANAIVETAEFNKAAFSRWAGEWAILAPDLAKDGRTLPRHVHRVQPFALSLPPLAPVMRTLVALSGHTIAGVNHE